MKKLTAMLLRSFQVDGTLLYPGTIESFHSIPRIQALCPELCLPTEFLDDQTIFINDIEK